MVCKRLIFYGKVQGVGFRWFTKKNALSLNLKGYVRNLRDGTVECVVCGNEEDINELVKRCKNYALARVEKIEIFDYDKESFDTFEIRF